MGRVFACSDIHGQRGLWDQIKAFLQQDDKLYFLGDAIDRGPDGYNIMKELLSDSRVTYIKGNHELMMEEAIREFTRNGGEWGGRKYQVWSWNGCESTIAAWEEAGSHCDIVNMLRNLSIKEIYINQEGREICLCHAGFTPGAEPRFTEDMVWDREHLLREVPEKYLDCHFIVVHGHTPTPHLLMEMDQRNKEYASFYSGWDPEDIPQYEYTEKDGAVVYGDGTKIDIDCGAFATGHIVLLDLDTFEVIPFDADIEG